MSQVRNTTSVDVTELLAGQECKLCSTGSLRKDRYKGNRAAVCDACGTPTVQVWSE